MLSLFRRWFGPRPDPEEVCSCGLLYEDCPLGSKDWIVVDETLEEEFTVQHDAPDALDAVLARLKEGWALWEREGKVPEGMNTWADAVRDAGETKGKDEMSNQIDPAHYKTESGLEAIEVIEAFFLDNVYRANVFKYLARAGKKNSDVLTCLKKARWYLNREIERREKMEGAA